MANEPKLSDELREARAILVTGTGTDDELQYLITKALALETALADATKRAEENNQHITDGYNAIDAVLSFFGGYDCTGISQIDDALAWMHKMDDHNPTTGKWDNIKGEGDGETE